MVKVLTLHKGAVHCSGGWERMLVPSAGVQALYVAFSDTTLARALGPLILGS